METLSFLKNNIEFISLFVFLILAIIGFISSWAVNVHTTRQTVNELSSFRDIILAVVTKNEAISVRVDNLKDDNEILFSKHKTLDDKHEHLSKEFHAFKSQFN